MASSPPHLLYFNQTLVDYYIYLPILVYFLLLLAQNLPTEFQVCPHSQHNRVGVFLGLKTQVNWQSARLESC